MKNGRWAFRWLLFGFLLGVRAEASDGAGLSYHGRLLTPQGNPVVSPAVRFKIQIRSSIPSNCLMYEEIQTKDLSQTQGLFSLTLNDGSATVENTEPYSLDRIFQNRGTFTFGSGKCSGVNTFSPDIAEGRRIAVSFNDGTFPAGTWEPLPTQTINFVPTAMEALSVGGYRGGQLFRVEDSSDEPVDMDPWTEANYQKLLDLVDSVTVFSGTTSVNGTSAGFTGSLSGDVTGGQSATKVEKIQGRAVSVSAPSNGDVLSWDAGTSEWRPVSPATGGGGDVMSTRTLTAGTGLTGGGDLSADRSFAVNVGTGANQIPQLDGSGKLATSVLPSSVLSSGASAGGDLTGTYPNPAIAANAVTAAKINDGAVGPSKLSDGSADGQVFRYDGSDWQIVKLDYKDLVNSISAGSPWPTASCTAGEVIIWSSVVDGFRCQSFAITETDPSIPSQSGQSGKILRTDGTNTSWVDPSDLTLSDYVSKAGDTMSGALALPADGLSVGTSELVVSGGKVGIGTANPEGSFKLDVVGPILNRHNTLVHGVNSSAPAGTRVWQSVISTADGRYNLGYRTDDVPTPGGLSVAPLKIYPNAPDNSLVLKEGMVGIGTNNPTQHLEVIGNVKATQVCIGSDCRSAWPGSGGGGTVTSITAGTGLTGGTITGSGTIGLGTELAGVNSITGTGFVKRTAAGSYSTQSSLSLTSDVTGSLPIANGGTGATTQAAAINNLLPSQSGNANKILQTNGTNVSWVDTPATGITALTGDVTASGSGSVTTTIANNAVNSAKISDGTVGVSDLNFAGTMATNTGIVVRNGTQFFNKTCSGNETLIWTVANGWSCSGVAALESDPKIGANTTNYLSKWNGTSLVASGVFESGGNVGIGTSSPASRFHVAGDGTTTLSLEGASSASMYTTGSLSFRRSRGTIASPLAVAADDRIGHIGAQGYGGSYGGEDSSAIDFHATEATTATNRGSDIRFGTTANGEASRTERMRITANGNVGIGTASPASSLHLVGAMTIEQKSDDNNGAGGSFRKSRGTAASPTAVQAGDRLLGFYAEGFNGTAYSGNVGAIQVRAAENFTSTAAGTLIDFGTTPVGGLTRQTRMTISDSGKVGIGTTSPTDALHAEGFSRTHGYLLKDQPNTLAQVYSALMSDGQDDQSALVVASAADAGGANNETVLMLADGQVNDDDGFSIVTWNANGFARNVLRARANGNVGIGTPAPSARLTVAADAPGNVSLIRAEGRNGTNNPGLSMFVDETSNVVGLRLGGTTVTDSFRIRNHAGSADLVTVKNNGNVGIGSTTPNSPLAVGGNGSSGWQFAVYGQGTGTSTYGIVHRDSADVNAFWTRDDGAAYIASYLGIGVSPSTSYALRTAGNVLVDGTVGDCILGNATGGVSCTSDARLKTNVEPISDALAKILRLRGVEYDWNEKTGRAGQHAVGVIAQEVEAVFPTLVSVEPDSGYRTVDYSGLVSPLIESTRELYGMCEAQGEKLRESERRVASLEEEVGDLKKRLLELEKKMEALASPKAK